MNSKRFVFCFAAAVMLSISTAAQHKVAVLAPVDKTRDIRQGIMLLVRGALTASISNMQGFEGYDGIDVDSAMYEQGLRRTGSSEVDHIQRIGRATGSEYVMTSEVAHYGLSSISVTARLFEVTASGVLDSAVAVSGVSADEITMTCSALVERLLLNMEQSNVSPVVYSDTDAVVEAKADDTTQYHCSPNLEYRIPEVACFLSILPGGGQLYNGQYLKAGILFGGYVAGVILSVQGKDKRGCIMTSAMIVSMIDAPISAKRINKKNAVALGVTPMLINTPYARNGYGVACGLNLALSF